VALLESGPVADARLETGAAAIRLIPSDTPAVTLPPVLASCHQRTVAQPRTPTTVGIERRSDEKGTADEEASVEVAVKEDVPMEAVKEDRPMEAVKETGRWK
jgi:hypothetical protein